MGRRGRDPTLKSLRSGFGAQVRSTSPSSPSCGFGTSVRESALRQYLSPEHAKAVSGNNSQGPVYKAYSSLGAQPDSTMASPGTVTFGSSARLPKPGKSGVPGPGAYSTPPALGEQKVSRRESSPRAVFGTATRDGRAKVYSDAELMSAFLGTESAPPGSYTVPGALGKQVVSTKASAPGIKIGTGLRALDNQLRLTRDLPGAGAYSSQGAVGKQTLSVKKSLPAHSFGRSTREVAPKIFISREHEKGAFGIASPGPATAAPYSGAGPQKLSTKASCPSFGFGTGKRLKDYHNDAPGPGAYHA